MEKGAVLPFLNTKDSFCEQEMERKGRQKEKERPKERNAGSEGRRQECERKWIKMEDKKHNEKYRGSKEQGWREEMRKSKSQTNLIFWAETSL